MSYTDINKKRECDRRLYQRHKEEYKTKKLAKQKERLKNSDIQRKEQIKASHRGFKREIFEKVENKCQNCGSSDNLQIHHVKYVEGKEGLQFIKVLCKKCHINEHYPLLSKEETKEFISRSRAIGRKYYSTHKEQAKTKAREYYQQKKEMSKGKSSSNECLAPKERRNSRDKI